MNPNNKIKIYALGDISLAADNQIEPSAEVFAQTTPVWADSDLVIGNLESPLLSNGSAVPHKCVLKANPQWAEALNSAGINLVSLANNHMMDFGPDGLFSTIEALNEAGVPFLGAGVNENSARAPYYVTLRERRIAFLARSSVVVASQCYASPNSPGVAYLDIGETEAAIKECKRHADTVVLIVHWGVEHYSYPTPSQRGLAHKFVEAGADLILGHHPHVLQGLESIDNKLVCYSLGNFVFDDIPWSFIDEEGHQQNRVVKLTQDNRKGGMLSATLPERGVESYEFLPTFIQPDGTVKLDNTRERKREFDRLSSRLLWPWYSLFWRAYSLKQEWKLRFKPLLNGALSWSKLKKLRLKHVKQLLTTVRSSTKIAAEKSTNPYE